MFVNIHEIGNPLTLPGLPSCFCRTLWAAVLASACLAAHAEIIMAVSSALLHSEQSCDLQAAHDDGRPGRWHWTVLETAGGQVVPGAGGLAKYHAPRTLVNRLIHLQVVDEANPLRVAVREIRVVPGLERDLLNWVMGPDWDVPKMTIYAGDPEVLPGAVNMHFGGITAICPIDDPAMPEGVNHHLAVADGWGIQMVSTTGEIRPWLGARVRITEEANGAGVPLDPNYFPCLGLAARPRDSRPGNPYHLVFAEQARDARSCCIFALEPDGSRRLVAGGAEVGFQDGPGPEARFGMLGDMVMDRDGNIFLLDRGNELVRRISPKGMVTTIAGQPGLAGTGADVGRDGLGAAATFRHLNGIALDSATGDLYVSDYCTIRRITPDGAVTTILGANPHGGELSPGGYALPSADPLVPVPLGFNCLDFAMGLAVQGRNLFIADSLNRSVRVWDLDHRTLHTLCGDPSQNQTRRGALGYFSPGKPPAECAAFSQAMVLAFSPSGMLLVGAYECIAELDMPRFVSPVRLAHPGGAESKEPRSGPAAPPAPPAAGTP
jgi:hypothetical protein